MSFYNTVRMSGMVLALLVLGVLNASASNNDNESAAEMTTRLRAAESSRSEKVAQIKKWLKDHPDSPDRIISEHLLAELYRGQYCKESMDTKAWRGQLERVVAAYEQKSKPLTPGPPTHGHAESNFLSVITATNVVVKSKNKIECKFAIPADAALGNWNIEVTNPAVDDDGDGTLEAAKSSNADKTFEVTN